jgi:hypothetical protein
MINNPWKQRYLFALVDQELKGSVRDHWRGWVDLEKTAIRRPRLHLESESGASYARQSALCLILHSSCNLYAGHGHYTSKPHPGAVVRDLTKNPESRRLAVVGARRRSHFSPRIGLYRLYCVLYKGWGEVACEHRWPSLGEQEIASPPCEIEALGSCIYGFVLSNPDHS